MSDERVQAPRTEGVGIVLPERKADCTGAAPSWETFVINKVDCDEDGPDPLPLTSRHLSVP